MPLILVDLSSFSTMHKIIIFHTNFLVFVGEGVEQILVNISFFFSFLTHLSSENYTSRNPCNSSEAVVMYIPLLGHRGRF